MNLSEPTRAYIYRILVATAAVAVAYGLIEAENVELWLVLAVAILGGGTGLAARNTSTSDDTTPD